MFGSSLANIKSLLGDLDQLNKFGLRMMLIIAYADNCYSISGIRGMIPVYLDYNNFQQSFSNQFSEDEAKGSPEGNMVFDRAGRKTLNCTFIFDSTGLVSGTVGETVPVNIQLNLFRKVALNVSGIEHQPHSLRLIWGRQQFKGVLENMTVSYTMFSPGGHPLRASVQASFIGSQKPGLSLAEAAFESPDMSHTRIAKEGLSLYQMSQDIYNDPKYYVQVAKHNDLNQFRKLKPGVQLDFPPINSST